MSWKELFHSLQSNGECFSNRKAYSSTRFVSYFLIFVSYTTQDDETPPSEQIDDHINKSMASLQLHHGDTDNEQNEKR